VLGRLLGREGGGSDAYLHVHAERIRGEPDECAVQRERVGRIPHDRDRDESGLADAAACRIEIDPAGTRQIDLPWPSRNVSSGSWMPLASRRR